MTDTTALPSHSTGAGGDVQTRMSSVSTSLTSASDMLTGASELVKTTMELLDVVTGSSPSTAGLSVGAAASASTTSTHGWNGQPVVIDTVTELVESVGKLAEAITKALEAVLGAFDAVEEVSERLGGPDAGPSAEPTAPTRSSAPSGESTPDRRHGGMAPESSVWADAGRAADAVAGHAANSGPTPPTEPAFGPGRQHEQGVLGSTYVFASTVATTHNTFVNRSLVNNVPGNNTLVNGFTLTPRQPEERGLPALHEKEATSEGSESPTTEQREIEPDTSEQATGQLDTTERDTAEPDTAEPDEITASQPEQAHGPESEPRQASQSERIIRDPEPETPTEAVQPPTAIASSEPEAGPDTAPDSKPISGPATTPDPGAEPEVPEADPDADMEW